MEAVVLVDPPERRPEVVGVAHEESARVLRQAGQADLRIEPQQVFSPLDDARQRPGVGIPRRRLSQPLFAGLVDLPAGLAERALEPEARRVDGVHADVRAVGGAHHRVELGLERGRRREAF